MGKFIKGTGNLLGKFTGSVLQAPFAITGKILKNDYIEEIGASIKLATEYTGKVVGSAASGTYEVASGLIMKDSEKAKEGASDVGRAVLSTAKGIGSGVVNILENSGELISGVADGDYEKVKNSSKQLFKTVVVATVAVGVFEFGPDVVEGIDNTIEEVSNSSIVASIDSTDFQPDFADKDNAVATETNVGVNPNMHYVDPYTRDDGTFVEGHYRTDPDDILSNNINYKG